MLCSMFKATLFPLCISILLLCSVSAIGQPSPLTDDFNDFVSQNLDHWHVPGFSIAVVNGNETFSKVLYSHPPPPARLLLTPFQGYGMSTLPSRPVTPSTLFYTGSTTKAFTACALALLISSSANTTSPLTWQTPISTLLPSDFVLPSDYATLHTTLEDAASHRTGMPRHDLSYGGPGSSVRDVVRSLRHLPMTAEPRTTWQYCNIMYTALSHVIETLTGKWLGDVLLERMWKPLGMTRTYFSLAHAKAVVDNGEAELARPYLWNNRMGEYSTLEWVDSPTVSGAGAMISNVLDYAKWLRFLMEKGDLLSEEEHEELRTPRINALLMELPILTGAQAYALGWHVLNYRGEPLIMHDGSLPGFGATIGYLPSKNFGFAMMGNSAGTSNFVCSTLAARLLDDYLSVPQEERFALAPVFDELTRTEAERLRHPNKDLFPTAPNGTNALPLSRPLEAYTGMYSDLGYRNINITLRSIAKATAHIQSPLLVSCPEPTQYLTSTWNRSWPVVFDFEHVSGEFFVLRRHDELHLDNLDLTDPLEMSIYKAEFRIGEDGKISEFGAAIEPKMGEEKVWFRKLE